MEIGSLNAMQNDLSGGVAELMLSSKRNDACSAGEETAKTVGVGVPSSTNIDLVSSKVSLRVPRVVDNMRRSCCMSL